MAEGGNLDQQLAQLMGTLTLEERDANQVNDIEFIVQIGGMSTIVKCQKFDAYYYVSAKQEGGRTLATKITPVYDNPTTQWLTICLCSSPQDSHMTFPIANMVQGTLRFDRTLLLYLKLTIYEESVIMELVEVLKTIVCGL